MKYVMSCQDHTVWTGYVYLDQSVISDVIYLESGFAFLQSFSCGRTSSNFKGQDGTIDVVVRTIDQHSLDAKDRKSCDDTVAEDRFNALLHTGDVFFGNGTTLDFTGKKKKEEEEEEKYKK